MTGRPPDPDGSGHRLLDQVHLAGSGMHGGVLHGTLLNLGNATRDSDHDAGSHEPTLTAGLGDEVAQHRLGNFKVGDDSILQGAYRGDVAGRASQHPFGLFTDGKNLGGAGLDRNNGRLAQDDAVILDIDQRVGGAEIDADIAGEKTENFFEHGMCKSLKVKWV